MRVAICLAAMWMICAGRTAEAQPLVERLPASTLVYVGWSPNAAMQTTAAAKMLVDERFMGPWRRVFQEFILTMQDQPDAGVRLSEHIAPMLMEAAQCEGCFALLELRQDKKKFNPQSVLMIDLGARRKKFEEHFKPIHLRMKDRVGDRLQMMKLDKSWVFFKPDREGKPVLTWGFVGDMFVVYFGDGAEDFIPKLVKGQIEAPLKTAKAFTESVGKIPGESVFTTFLDTKAAFAILRKLIERENNNDLLILTRNWDGFLAELGLVNVIGVAEKTTIEDKQFVTRTLIKTTGEPAGLLKFIASDAVDDAMMKVIPVDAMAATAFRLDLSKTYDQIKSSGIKLMGRDAEDGFKELEQGSEGLGLPLKDVLAPIGDQWVVYNAASQGGFALTGWTMAVNIRDQQKFDKIITTVRAMVAKGMGGDHVRIREMKVDDTRIEFVELGRWSAPFAPAWAVVDGKFVFGLYPQLVEDAIKHIKEGGKSILDNPDYAASRKRTGNSGAMVYMGGPEVVKNVYPIGLFVASLINSFGGGFRDAEDDAHMSTADLLPSMQRLMQYVGHDTISIKLTADGILKTRSAGNPLLSPLTWIDSPTLWIALGIPTLVASEEAADRIKSEQNLRQLGQGIQIYANENKLKYPPNLPELVKTQDFQAGVLTSPFGPAKDGKGDYIYVHFANMTTETVGADTIVVYDQSALESGEGTAALLGDGRVQWYGPEEFKKALEESKKKTLLKNVAP